MEQSGCANNWNSLLDGFAEAILEDHKISEERWFKLLDAANSLDKCRGVLYWMMRGKMNGETEVVYAKLKRLASQSFYHQRKLALAAKALNDADTLNKAIDLMIERAKEKNYLAWWESVLEFLPKDDPRSVCIEVQIALMKKERSNSRKNQ